MTQIEHRKIHFSASDSDEAQQAKNDLEKQYPHVEIDDADIVVALGGDGHMLQTLRKMVELEKPVYGMNRGTVGFLMNDYSVPNLMHRLDHAEMVKLHPLQMTCVDINETTHENFAINEVSLLRETRQAAKLQISVDKKVRMNELICDGCLVSTPAGSTAYNLSAHGPILPINASLLALTPISAFRPRRWHGALLPHDAVIGFRVLEARKRPVSVVSDNIEIRDVQSVSIRESQDITLKLLFDPGQSLSERILTEQFLPSLH